MAIHFLVVLDTFYCIKPSKARWNFDLNFVSFAFYISTTNKPINLAKSTQLTIAPTATTTLIQQSNFQYITYTTHHQRRVTIKRPTHTIHYVCQFVNAIHFKPPPVSTSCVHPIAHFQVGYTMRDIRYKWNEGPNSVGVSSEVSLPQFKVLGHRQRAMEISLTTGTCRRSPTYIAFQFSIKTIHLIHTYTKFKISS